MQYNSLAFVAGLKRATDKGSLPEIAQYSPLYLPLNVLTAFKSSNHYILFYTLKNRETIQRLTHLLISIQVPCLHGINFLLSKSDFIVFCKSIKDLSLVINTRKLSDAFALKKLNPSLSVVRNRHHKLFNEQKGTSRQRSGKGAIRKRFPLQKPRWEKTKLTIRYLYHETYRKPNEQFFPNRWPLSYLNLTKNMKTYIRRQQHKKKFKH